MSRVDELMLEVGKSARKVKLEQTALLLGESMLAIDESIADRPNPDSRADIESKFVELNRKTLELIYHKKNIKKLTDKLEREIRRIEPYVYDFERAAILPKAVVYFVHLLEKANQFLEYKRRAMLSYNFEKEEGFPCEDEICETLLQDHQLKSQFNYIVDDDISDAAQSIFWELVCKQNKQPIPQDKPVLFNWIYRLVSSARQEDYVMDQDPEVELKKMMKNEPGLYDMYFLSEQLPEAYNNISKVEAYEKYSKLVHSITTRRKDALEERQKSTSTTTARDSEAFDQKHKVTSTAISARNKEAVEDEKHELPSIVKRKRATDTES